MQTFSKAFGLASARIGMAFADSSVIKYFNKMKPPYNISTINQKAALKALDRTGLYRNRICKIKNERLRLTTELNKLQLTEKIFPSEANFLLVKVNNAKAIYNYLAERKIIVRNRSNVVENCLRVTVGTRSENDKLLKALKTFTS